MPHGKHPENVSPYTGLRVPVCKGTYTQEGGGLMLQGYTMAIVPCGNPTPKKLPTGGGEWPTFRTARAQRAHSARYAPLWSSLKERRIQFSIEVLRERGV